jgi:hypothetical protein
MRYLVGIQYHTYNSVIKMQEEPEKNDVAISEHDL